MKDGLGNEIQVGSKVVWVGGKTIYAGVKVYEVVKLNPKMVRIDTGNRETNVYPNCLVVVDKLV